MRKDRQWIATGKGTFFTVHTSPSPSDFYYYFFSYATSIEIIENTYRQHGGGRSSGKMIVAGEIRSRRLIESRGRKKTRRSDGVPFGFLRGESQFDLFYLREKRTHERSANLKARFYTIDGVWSLNKRVFLRELFSFFFSFFHLRSRHICRGIIAGLSQSEKAILSITSLNRESRETRVESATLTRSPSDKRTNDIGSKIQKPIYDSMNGYEARYITQLLSLKTPHHSAL